MQYECIDATGAHLTRGKMYTEIPGATPDWLTVQNDIGNEFTYSAMRFRLRPTAPIRVAKDDYGHDTNKQAKVYIGGALKNTEIVRITKVIAEAGYDAFSEWYTPGPEADVLWRDYELALGYDYREALQRASAQNTFQFDKRNIDDSESFVLVLPAGKSAHLELGYAIGQGKRGIIYMPEQPDRWDVMYGFADAIVYNDEELLEALTK